MRQRKVTVPQLLQRPYPNVGRRTEIDVELLTFIERYATNLARWDLIMFFGQNPTFVGNAAETAHQIGRQARSVAKELGDLAYLGILRASLDERGVRYELTRIPAIRRTALRFARLFGPRRN